MRIPQALVDREGVLGRGSERVLGRGSGRVLGRDCKNFLGGSWGGQTTVIGTLDRPRTVHIPILFVYKQIHLGELEDGDGDPEDLGSPNVDEGEMQYCVERSSLTDAGTGFEGRI